MTELTRRAVIGAGLSLPMLTLPACVPDLLVGTYDFDAAARRLMSAASRRAFTALTHEWGFYHDQVARVRVPAELGGGGGAALLQPLLQDPAVQESLIRTVNRAASDATRAAIPVVYQAIPTIRIGDPIAVIRGGPTAASDYLHRSLGNRVYDALFPAVGAALRRFDDGTLDRALAAAPAYSFAALQRHVAYNTQEGIYRAIGREEAAIRRNPALSGDRYLMEIYEPLR